MKQGDSQNGMSWQDWLGLRNDEVNKQPIDPSNGLHYSDLKGGRSYLPPETTPEDYLNQDGSFLHGNAEWNAKEGKYERPINWGNLIGLGTAGAIGGFGIGGALGGVGGGSAATSATPAAHPGAGIMGAPSTAAASTGGGHVGILGSIGKYMGMGGGGGASNGVNLGLGALSLLKKDNTSPTQSFDNPGAITDPTQSLNYLLQAIQRLGQGMSERGPTRLRSSVVQGSPAPVNIPGLGFQIGGGMGADPALKDPSLLESDPGRNALNKYDPFQGGPNPEINTPVKRRNP